MADEKEYSNLYTIPPNYTDSGKLFGGMLEPRNTAEAGILLLMIGYPELMWIHLPPMAKVVIMTVTLLPLTVFALMGLGGDSLSQYTAHIVLFLLHRRQLHYRRIGYCYETAKKTQKHTKRPCGKQQKKKKTGIRSEFHPPQRDTKRHRGDN